MNLEKKEISIMGELGRKKNKTNRNSIAIMSLGSGDRQY